MSKWTDEEAEAAYWKCVEDWSPQSEWSIRPTIGRALLDAREQVATLKAEVKAWRKAHEVADINAFKEDVERIGHCEDAYEIMHRSIEHAVCVQRHDTDALFKEGL